MSKKILIIIISCPIFIFPYSLSFAGETGSEGSSHASIDLSCIYIKDRISLQIVSGLLFSPTVLASQTVMMDYWQTNMRLGWMLTEIFQKQSFLRGNFEALFELSYSYIYKGPGHHLVGITALLRHNFVQPEPRIAPYFQVGAGIVYTDAYKDPDSGIGQSIEFTPQGSLGLRFLINRQVSLDAEAMFHHISNAGLAERNEGINAFGGFLGMTYFFHSPSLLRQHTHFERTK